VEENKLQRSGVLAWIRHPIYAGLILVILGFFLFIPNLPTLVSCGCMLMYLPVGIYLEERKLIKIFGQEYIAYRNEVPAILPNFSKFRES
jgi:protein-S-isoprenylcysteine O-methyltransferase Ste14